MITTLKRDRLIEAAKILFYQQGVTGTTLADIAQQAEVPLGNIYYHFRTKEALVEAVIQAHLQELQSLFARLDRQPDIWSFLKRCYERGLIYKGHDVMTWCPRCATGISNMETLSEDYQDTSHLSLYVRLPLVDRPGEYLLVWTTTPWTLAANVAAAVQPDLTYVKVEQDG